jgi:Protein of unknown function (DUF3298).
MTMNINFKKIIAILMCGMMIVGCRPKKAFDPEAENDIKFDSIVVNEKYYLLGDSTNPYCTLESSFIFPSDYKDKEAYDNLTSYFIYSFFGDDTVSTSPKEATDNYIQKYISDYKELESDFITETDILGRKPSQESWFAYYEVSSNEILYNKCDLLSYSVSIEYYTGGAHGGHGYNNHVLYLKTGKKLNETDIFVENYDLELAQIIIDAIAEDNELSNPIELEEMGYFNVAEIYPNNNFYVDESGITYTFNEYEIAAYVIGRTDVFLPFEKISHLLRDDSPIAPIAFITKK